jgi:hypothetical protein
MCRFVLGRVLDRVLKIGYRVFGCARPQYSVTKLIVKLGRLGLLFDKFFEQRLGFLIVPVQPESTCKLLFLATVVGNQL